MSKKSTIYVAYINSDLTEGKGYNIPFAVSESEATAKRLGKGKNTQGSDAIVKPIETIALTIGGKDIWYAPIKDCIHLRIPTLQDKQNDKRQLLKEKALQKAKEAGLTEKEIKLIQGK